MRRSLISAFVCAWRPDTTPVPPSCARLTAWWTSPGIQSVVVPEGHRGVIDSCSVAEAILASGVPSRPCGDGGAWIELWPGSHSVLALGGTTAYLLSGNAGERAVPLVTAVSTLDVCVSSALSIQEVVATVRDSRFTYSNIQTGTFARVESATTSAGTLLSTIEYFARNATPIDVGPILRTAGAFFPQGVSLPMYNGVPGLPGVFDAKWTLPLSAFLISLVPMPGTTPADTQTQVDNIRSILSTNILGVRIQTREIPEGPSNVRQIAANVALIAPLLTLSFSVVTTTILVLTFWRNGRAAQEQLAFANANILTMQQQKQQRQIQGETNHELVSASNVA